MLDDAKLTSYINNMHVPMATALKAHKGRFISSFFPQALFLWTLKSPLRVRVLFAKVALFMDSKNSFLYCAKTPSLVLASRTYVLFHKLIFNPAYDVRKLPFVWTPKTR